MVRVREGEREEGTQLRGERKMERCRVGGRDGEFKEVRQSGNDKWRR